ncbi:MAG TPA: PAS domain S-box protein [Anaerolineae bacterium]|nr:PAS domain S-box protein [Anaerolineae bacterium]
MGAVSMAKNATDNNQWSIKLLHTLNAAAVAIQKSSHTAEDIFRVFRTQLTTANMGGAILLLDPPGDPTAPDATATAFANTISNKTIRDFERKFHMSADGLKFKLSQATTMREVILTRKTKFIADSQPLLAQYIPPVAAPFAAVITRPFKNIPSIDAPIYQKERIVGVLAFTTSGLTPADIPAVEAFAHHIGIALENARLIESLQSEITRRRHTEAQLAVSESHYRTLVENAPVAIAIHDGEVMRFVNPALKKLLHIKNDEEVIGQSIWKYISKSSVPVAAERIKAVVQQGLPVPPMEEKFITPDGSTIDVEAVGTPIMFEGKPASLVVFHELSLQKRTQRQLEQQLSQLTLLNEIGREISTMLSLEQLFARTVHLVHEKFGYHHVAIFTRDEHKEKMVMRARAGGYAALFPKNHTLKYTEGMVGWVVQNNQTRVANDVSKDRNYYNPLPHHPEMHTCSELTIPITAGGVVEGVLDIQSTELNAFDKQQVMVMETLAQQLSAAIENARFFDATSAELTERRRAETQLRRSNRELRLLNKIISVTATSPKLSDILDSLCHEFAIALNVEWGGVVSVAANKKSGTLLATHRMDNRPIAIQPDTTIPFPPPVQKLIKDAQPVTVDNCAPDWKLSRLVPALSDTKVNLWALFVPIMDSGSVVGILAAGTTAPREFSAADTALAQRVAEQLSGIMARIRLERTREQLTAAIEQSTEAILITDTRGNVSYANPAFFKMSGYLPSEIIGARPGFLIDIDTVHDMQKSLHETQTWQGNIEFRKKTGGTFIGETVIMPISSKNNPSATNFVVTIRDITQELALEEQLRQAQKLEAVGQLAAGIAHDFNNLLTAINGFSELLLERVEFGTLEYEYVLQILESGNRAADLVSQLLAFSRKQLIKPYVLNLNQVILDMQKMLRRVIGEHIRIETKLSPVIYPLKLDPSQIEQIVLNLAVNAQDAMPQGGALLISTDNVLLSAKYTETIPDIEPGEYVCLSITDTGEGIEPELLNHIFEPFFTTKEVGKGTGLGLATVYGIVKQNRGHIDVSSAPGEGTTFYIYLPRTDEAEIAPPLETEEPVPRGTENILFVEDSEHVLEMAQTILSELGYTVFTALNAEQAIKQAQALDAPLDLLIADIILPRMNGLVLASAVQELFPAIKTLYISGYNESTLPLDIHKLDSNSGFLEKPFTAIQLAQAVREVLDR